MSIPFVYDREANVIRSTCNEDLSDKDIREYFSELLAKKNEISGADEYVDFTRVQRFDSSHAEFARIKHLYETLSDEKVVVRTVFKVGNSHQYGMARMYSGLVEMTGNTFGFEFDGWEPDEE